MQGIAEIDIALIDAYLYELSKEPATSEIMKRIDQILDRRNEISKRDESISLRFDAA